MALVIRDNQVYKGETLVYEAPATIIETAILDNGVIILYDPEETLPPYSYHGASDARKPTKQELFDAKKNVIKLDYDGNMIWQISMGLADGSRKMGYKFLFESNEDGWTIVTGKDYRHRLNAETDIIMENPAGLGNAEKGKDQ